MSDSQQELIELTLVSFLIAQFRPKRVIAGRDESDFLLNADNAQAMWDNVITSTANEVLPPSTLRVHSPFPHPAITSVVLPFETAAQSGVEVDVYNILGRRVRRLLDGRRPGGQHTVTWDGLNESGIRVAPGLYLVWITAKSGSQVHVDSRPVALLQ